MTSPIAANARRYAESERLLEQALRRIPLGSQTFSKSHQQFVRGAMPQFLERGRGCRVTDADGYEYIDYVLGLLPVVLGYCDPDVDGAIRAQLERGITFSLPTALEFELADRLARLIPSAEKARFGKSGSDATSAAVRLARAFTGRDKVIACGYHGWHDWYIGATTRRLGVPESVSALTATVPYNDPERIGALLRAEPDAYAALVMEPVGVEEPRPGYLEEVRRLTAHYGVLLVFDEIVSGFRINLGGAQAEYGVTPDLACFGKAMGNGMPIAAVVGRGDIMDLMEQIFFSGTFGGEALSLAAAMATLDKLERENAVQRMRARGRRLTAGVRTLLDRHGLAALLAVGGSDWWPRWKLVGQGVDANLVLSLLRQETAARGLLLLNTFNLSLAHDRDAVEAETLAALDGALAALGGALNDPNPAAHLRGEIIRPTFAVRPA